MRAIPLGDAVRIIAQGDASGRRLTAIARPPASGKSTAAEALAAILNRVEPRSAAVVPMDGFHYDDRVLIARGLRAKEGRPPCAGARHAVQADQSRRRDSGF